MPSRPAKLAANLTRDYWHGIDLRHTVTRESAHRCCWTASVRDFSCRPGTVYPHAAGMDEAPAHSASQGRPFRLLRSCRGGGPYPHQAEGAGSGIRTARYRAQSKRHSVCRSGPIQKTTRACRLLFSTQQLNLGADVYVHVFEAISLNHRRKIRLGGDDLRNEVSFRLVETPYPLRLAATQGHSQVRHAVGRMSGPVKPRRFAREEMLPPDRSINGDT